MRACACLHRLYGVHKLPFLPSQELNQDDKGKKFQACVSVGQSLLKVQSVVVGAGRSAGCTTLTAAGQTGAALASGGMERAALAATGSL